jgi:hypothetical protein
MSEVPISANALRTACRLGLRTIDKIALSIKLTSLVEQRRCGQATYLKR